MRAVAAVLFLGVCAYIGAALYRRLDRDLETVTVGRVTVTDSAALTGIAVRREQLVCSPDGAAPLIEDGARAAAGALIARDSEGRELRAPCSALFLSGTDGFESLSPEALTALTADGLEALLAEKPASVKAAGRLVSGFDWYYAAFSDAPLPLAAGDACSVQFDGTDRRAQARVMSISGGVRPVAVLRLTCAGEFLSLRKTGAKLIFSEYTGLELPEEAVRTDGDGRNYVYTLTAGVIERKAVEIIYSAGGKSIAAVSDSADALREGNTLIVSGENIYEGRVTAP